MVGERGIVGRDRAGVGEGTEIFARIKTHAGGVAEGTRLFSVAAGAVGLRGVFEDEESVACGDGVDRLHVCGLSVEVDREKGLRARRDQRGEARGVEVVGQRIGLAGNGAGADVGDGEPRGDVAVGGDDHFIPGADATGHEHELHGFEAVGDADAVSDADAGGVFGFK